MSRVEPERNKYVGHRYVPKIFGEWNQQNEYEGLSIVTHEGASYTSKKRVPVGIDISNEEFWVVTGNYDAQVEYYRAETAKVKQSIIDLEQSVDSDLTDNKQYLDDSIDSVNEEILLRGINVKNPPYPLESVENNGEDETEKINAIIRYAHDNGINNVIFPDGVYLVYPGSFDNVPMGDGGGIELLDNITLRLNDNAIIQSLPSTGQGYNVIRAWRKKNISVIGGKIIGDRKNHLGTGGEWGHGINIRGCENVTIDTTVNDCWGDGVYAGPGGLEYPTKNLNIIYLNADNNRRQGISMTHVDGFNIDNLILTNTNGTNPQAGIDIEPNANERVVNGFINNIYTEGNSGSGVQIFAGATGAVIDNIIIDKVISLNNRANGLICRRELIKGVVINTLITKNNDVDGFRVADGASGVSVKEIISTGNNRGLSLSKANDVYIGHIKLYDNAVVSYIGESEKCLIESIDVLDVNVDNGLFIATSNEIIIKYLKIKEAINAGLYVTSTTKSDINVDVANCGSYPILINSSKGNSFKGIIRSQAIVSETVESLIRLQNASTDNTISGFNTVDYTGDKVNNAVFTVEGSKDNFIGFNNFKDSYSGNMIIGVGFNNVGYNFPIDYEV